MLSTEKRERIVFEKRKNAFLKKNFAVPKKIDVLKKIVLKKMFSRNRKEIHLRMIENRLLEKKKICSFRKAVKKRKKKCY